MAVSLLVFHQVVFFTFVGSKTFRLLELLELLFEIHATEKHRRSGGKPVLFQTTVCLVERVKRSRVECVTNWTENVAYGYVIG